MSKTPLPRRWFVVAALLACAAVIFPSTQPALGETYVRRLTPYLPAYATINTTQMSPDGQYLFFTADIRTDEISDLYSLRIRDRLLTRLTTLTSGEGVWTVKITPDSSRLIFTADMDTVDKVEIYSVPISGGTAVKLNGTIVPANGDISGFGFSISPDSQRVVYGGDQEVDEQFNLYSVMVTGGGLVRLNDALGTLGDVWAARITADSQFVVFMADQAPGFSTDNQFHLFYSPITSRNMKRLSDEMPDDSTVAHNEDFVLLPDSSGAVYIVESGNGYGPDNLYVSSFYGAAGPSPIPLTSNTGWEDIFDLVLTHFSPPWVVFRMGEGDIIDLYGVPVDASAEPLLLSHDLPGGEMVEDFVLSHNEQGVVYRSNHDDNHDFAELFSRLFIPPYTMTQLHPEMPDDRMVASYYQLTPNDVRVLFRCDMESNDVFDLYSRASSGAGSPVRLNPVLTAGGDVSDFAVSPNSAWLVYQADQISNDVLELFLVSTLGPPAVRISLPLVDGGNVIWFRISPDGKQIIYRADGQVNDQFELYLIEDVDLVYLPALQR